MKSKIKIKKTKRKQKTIYIRNNRSKILEIFYTRKREGNSSFSFFFLKKNICKNNFEP